MLAAALTLPFLLAEIPPILDYPNHLARTLVLASGQNDAALSQMCAPAWNNLPIERQPS